MHAWTPLRYRAHGGISYIGGAQRVFTDTSMLFERQEEKPTHPAWQWRWLTLLVGLCHQPKVKRSNEADTTPDVLICFVTHSFRAIKTSLFNMNFWHQHQNKHDGIVFIKTPSLPSQQYDEWTMRTSLLSNQLHINIVKSSTLWDITKGQLRKKI